MHISAQVNNIQGKHVVNVRTNGNTQSLTIPPKSMGFGSSVNGGELLFLALATCYCNDIYREAANKGIKVTGVEVTVEGEFGGPGEPARNVTYKAKVSAYAAKSEIDDLMIHTDTVAEIQNTLRKATQVTLNSIEAISL
jgi:organic hydroperoxide reductase OsmC/OhrA